MPSGPAGELDWLLFRQNGVISRRQALRLLSEKRLRHLVASGRWRAAHRGVLLAHTGPITQDQRVWIAILAVGPSYLGGVAALRRFGLRGVRSRTIDVLLPASRRTARPPAGVVVHRTRALPRQDRRPGNPPHTMPARSVVDAAQWAGSDDEARLIVAAAFQQRLVAGTDVDEVLARMPVARRRRLILHTAHDAVGGSHALGELDLLTLCRKAGLPLPSRQVVRTDRRGRRRYLDAYWEQWRLHVEIDGAHHMEVGQWWDDMQRQNALWVAGDRVLRFPAWLLRERPDEVIAQLRAAFIAAGWRPTM
jgi:hypothetical protein